MHTTKTVASQTTSPWIPLDDNQAAFNVSLVVEMTGTLTYTVEFTLDNVQDPGVTPAVFPVAGLAAKTASASSYLRSSTKAVRLNVIAYTSGSATLGISQGTSWDGVGSPEIDPKLIVKNTVPFLIMPGDGAANGCQFTGTNGEFTLSAAIIANIGATLSGCYAYFSANFGGSSLPADWYWTEFSSDTTGIVYAETYSVGSGEARRPATKTPITPNLSGWVTGSTSEIVGPSGFILPGNALGNTGYLQVFLGVAGSTAGTKSYRTKIDTTNVVTTATTTSPIGESLHTITCTDSPTEKLCGRTSSTAATGVGGYSNTYSTVNSVSVNTAVSQSVSISLQQSTNVAAAILLRALALATYGE